MLPGLALARAINSGMLRGPKAGLTIRKKGARASSATASKLPSASQGVFCSTAVVGKEEEVTISV